jgi:hypothetical protein
MLCVYCETGELIVVTASFDFTVRELPSRAATLNAMSLSRCDTVVSLSYDLVVEDQHGPHLSAGARATHGPYPYKVRERLIPARA